MKKASALLVVALLGAGAAPAWAQNGKLIDTFDDWSAFASADKSQKVCYMASAPKKKDPAVKKRGDAYITISHSPATKSIGVLSIRSGYAFKKGSEVEVTIGTETVRMFTEAGYAWTYDPKDDRRMLQAMKGAKDLSVKGTAENGTATKDTYSLKGIKAAHEAINKACDVK